MKIILKLLVSSVAVFIGGFLWYSSNVNVGLENNFFVSKNVPMLYTNSFLVENGFRFSDHREIRYKENAYVEIVVNEAVFADTARYLVLRSTEKFPMHFQRFDIIVDSTQDRIISSLLGSKPDTVLVSDYVDARNVVEEEYWHKHKRFLIVRSKWEKYVQYKFHPKDCGNYYYLSFFHFLVDLFSS